MVEVWQRPSETPPEEEPVDKFSDLGKERLFFISENAPFVLDKTSSRMFLMVGDNLEEITASDIKLEIVYESPTVNEREALKLASFLAILDSEGSDDS